MRPGANLVFHAKNTDFVDYAEMRIISYSGSENIAPHYELSVEERYSRASIRLTEDDIRRLFSCLSSEIMNSSNLPKLQPRIDPDCLEDDEGDYEMQGGDNCF